MLTRKTTVGLAAFAGLVLMVLWMAGVFDDRIPPGTGAAAAGDNEASYRVAREQVAMEEPVAGSVEAKQATVISSRTVAQIERIHVRAGDRVKEGDLLLELEQRDLQARLQQVASRVESIAARLKEAEQNLQRAAELERKGVLAAADLDAAQANRDALQAELESARQAQREAQASLAFANIHSPIDGRVIDRFAEPGDTAAPGVKLLSLYNPLSLRVEAQVREALALGLVLGQSLPVDLPAVEAAVEGQVEEIVPAAQAGSRTFQVKLRLPFDERLLPGMYARVRVPAGTASRLLVPRSLVARVGQLTVVRVLGENGEVGRRFVRLGDEYPDGRVEVLAGLEPGEQLVALP